MHWKSKGPQCFNMHYCSCNCYFCLYWLSIRQAAESAKESTLEGLNITATISYDRSSMMNDIMGGMPPGNGEDKHYGLGLAIAKAIATSHKGDIAVKSYDGFVKFVV